MSSWRWSKGNPHKRIVKTIKNEWTAVRVKLKASIKNWK